MNFYKVIPIILTIIGAILIEKKEQGVIKKWLSGSRPFIALHYFFPAVLGIESQGVFADMEFGSLANFTLLDLA